MKNILTVDLDTDREETIRICKAPEFMPSTPEEEAEEVIGDMATLCEGLCTLIHLADQNGIKKGVASLKSCIKHLEAGHGDIFYKAFTVGNN